MTVATHAKESAPAPAATRRVRSFVCRPGRITHAQRRALESHWERFGIQTGNGPLDLDAIFGRRAPRYLEIGFGMGGALVEMALANPGCDYLGIEVYDPGIGRVLHELAGRDMGNVRIIRADAVEVLDKCIPAGALAGVFLYFPDPWPKKRHHKRRIVQPDFVSLVCARLESGGRFELATDWAEYAGHMLRVLEAEPQLHNRAGPGRFPPRPGHRPQTRFERRGQAAGREIRDLAFTRRFLPAADGGR